jgi:hypothetical protein
MDNIILPRKDSDGRHYISYSQWTSWKSAKSFSLGVQGRIEYMVGYFFGKRFPDQGWAEFGQDVEDYICERTGAEKFTQRELDVLNKIEPLGVFQTEVKWEFFPGVYLLGYIDDALPGFPKIRDYKTGSKSSTQQYHLPGYKQLNIYAGWVQQEFGFIPEAEVYAIERKGNCFGMVNARDRLSVGEEIWIIPRLVTQEDIDGVRAELVAATFEISEAYKTFLKLNEYGDKFCKP